MKSKISYSTFSIIVTIVVTGVICMGCIFTVHEERKFFILLALYVLLLFITLFFGPAYISADGDAIRLGSLLRSKKIDMREVESVEPFQPTMGAIRVFGSGGFMGYWGFYREGDIGRYYAFYGKSTNCFILRLRNGEKYVLGCDDA